jgi:dihydrofolate synthase/folylpolyglutamate synthase
VAAAAIEAGLDRDRVEVVEDVAEAVARAVALTDDDEQVVVTGSLYVVGAARAALLPGT